MVLASLLGLSFSGSEVVTGCYLRVFMVILPGRSNRGLKRSWTCQTRNDHRNDHESVQRRAPTSLSRIIFDVTITFVGPASKADHSVLANNPDHAVCSPLPAFPSFRIPWKYEPIFFSHVFLLPSSSSAPMLLCQVN